MTWDPTTTTATMKTKLIDTLKLELKRCIVTERNMFVTRQLKNLYQERVPTGELQVFCASNVDHWDNRDAPHQKASRFSS